MTPKSPSRMVSVRLEAELVDAMQAMQVKYGTPLTEQVRRALRPWLISQGFLAGETPTAEPGRGKRSKQAK